MKDIIKKYGKPALAIATFIALMHILWALVVAIGVGQAFLDWIFPLHFVNSIYAVIDFNILTAFLLAIASFAGTYLAVLMFGVIWEMIMKKR